MSTNRITRLSRRHARALLDRPQSADGDAIARLMAAATAAGAPGEADGEQSAVAHFRAVTPALRSRSTAWRPSMIKSLFSKVVAAKLLTAATVAAASGGIALAAAHGQLNTRLTIAAPAPSQSAHHHGTPTPAPSSVPSTPPADGTTTAPAGTDSSTASDQPTETAPSDPQPSDSSSAAPVTSSPAPSSTAPAASLRSLCLTVRAAASGDLGAALGSGPLSTLVSAAGGLNAVGSYCANLLGGTAAQPNPAPTHTTGHRHSTGSSATGVDAQLGVTVSLQP